LVNGLEVAGVLNRDAAELFSQHSIELLSGALVESRSNEPAALNALREALFVRACRLIRLKSGDPHLAADQIAHQLGISTRLLQRIFAERGKTVMRHIFAERTNLAARLLTDPGAAHRRTGSGQLPPCTARKESPRAVGVVVAPHPLLLVVEACSVRDVSPCRLPLTFFALKTPKTVNRRRRRMHRGLPRRDRQKMEC
jgi:AraC-like DNA-binding protein